MSVYSYILQSPESRDGVTQPEARSIPTWTPGEVAPSEDRMNFPEYGVIKDEVFDRVEGFVQYPLSTEETSDDIQNPCGMCYSKSTEMVFKECGHLYGCEDGCKQLENPECPVCRNPSGFIKLITV